MPKKKRGKSNTRKNKLSQFDRELRYGRLTAQRAAQQWKDLCKRITIPKLKEDVIITSNSFEKAIDTKDFIISLYMDEIYNQEDSHMIAIRQNYHNIERIMEVYFSTVYSIHEETNRELQRRIEQALQFLNTLSESEENSEMLINLVSFGMERQRKANEKETKMIQFGERNEMISKYQDDIHKITSIMEGKFGKVWEQLKKVQNEYASYIKKNKDKYDSIKQVDDVNTRTVQKELNKLQSLQEMSKCLTYKLKELDNSLGHKLKLLESERNSLKEYFIIFKTKLQRDIKQDDVSRTLITVEFTKVFDYLIKKMNDGEKMLMMVNCCRRYETIADKVLPFPFDNETEQVTFSEDPFILFWHKIAGVQSSRCALNEECNYLKIENRKLKEQIHNHCQCFYCPVLPPIPKRAGRIPHTDGKQLIRKNKTQNRPK